ncbi:hypothetical protein BJV78DRAFT_1285128 [Lactifluus subvellereus]|nr:hypothetical protein BJV78DRAFT_1285128 [Lactifluus subvellereus]
MDNAERHTLRHEYIVPSSPLQTLKPRRIEELQPEDGQEGGVTSTGASASRQGITVSRSSERQAEAKRIRLEQLRKGTQMAALQLRQRATDLEHGAAEDEARLLPQIPNRW